MRILLLNLYYPPDTSATARMAATVVEALSAKHQVTVLCGRPSYDPAERHRWYLYRREKRGNVTVLRAGSTDYPRFRMKQRVLNYLTYAALALPRALFVPADVVLAMTDPPFAGIFGAVAALLKRKPYVYNIRDMYPDMALGGGILPPGPAARLWERLHRWALRRARRVIVLGDDMRARIIGKGVDAARVVIARDGVDLSPAASGGADPEVTAQIRNGFQFVFLHAGNLGFYGAWETLLTAARRLEKEHPGIGFVFVGEGAQCEQLKRIASGLSNVRFLPFFPAEKIPSVLAAGDVHVVTLKRGLEGVVVPSKLYGILAAGKPVLAVAPEESDAARIVHAAACGFAADPDRPEEVTDAVRELVRDPQRLRNMGDNARVSAARYGRVEHLEKFLRVIEEAAEA